VTERSLDRCKYCDKIIEEFYTENIILKLLYSCSARELRCLLSFIVENKSFAEIAKEYSVTRDRIIQICEKAIKKIQRKAIFNGLQIDRPEIKEAILKNAEYIPFLKPKTAYIIDVEKLEHLSKINYRGYDTIPQEFLDRLGAKAHCYERSPEYGDVLPDIPIGEYYIDTTEAEVYRKEQDGRWNRINTMQEIQRLRISETCPHEITGKSFDDFMLSHRTRNCLGNCNIKTIGDLITKTESDLLMIKGFGRHCLSEVKEALQIYGLKLLEMEPQNGIN
jgi:predicted DNA-binding protein YlxM (UPF0122 family)